MIAFYAFIIFLVNLKTSFALECFCSGDGCAPWQVNNTCVAEKGGKCFAFVRELPDEVNKELKVIEYNLGCLPGDTHAILQCNANLPRQVFYRFHILCCDDEDFCNVDLEPELPAGSTTTPSVPESETEKPKVSPPWIYAVIGVAAFCSLGFIGVALCMCFMRGKKTKYGLYA